MDSRTIHIVVAGFIALIGCLAAYVIPDLRKDAATTFATIGGFVTVYGVAFSVVEVVRARKSAALAATEAAKAVQIIQDIYDIRGLSECQSCIEHALNGLESDGMVPISHLSRIVKLYVAEFHEYYTGGHSSHRDNVAIIQSYALVRGVRGKTSAGRLRVALLQMMEDLSISAGKRTSQERHR